MNRQAAVIPVLAACCVCGCAALDGRGRMGDRKEAANAAPASVIVPTSEKEPVVWRYTFDAPGADWFKVGFDDSQWKQGPGGFGTPATPGAVARTEWNTSDIWLRRKFVLPEAKVDAPALRIHHDEDAKVYINCALAAEIGGFTTDYEEVELSQEARAALTAGENTMAVHCQQTSGGQYIDVGIVRATPVPKLPAIQPLFDFPLRDTCICLVDGVYYLTGTTGYPTWWKTNEGIRVWKSTDLRNWEPLGLVWSIEEDGTWQKESRDGNRAIWAPEIHHAKGTFWLTYCVNYGGTGILRSTTGKAEGPYKDIKPDGPLTGEIDASMFEDTDGKVYFVYQDGKIARMNDELTGLAEPPRLLKPANAAHVGFEGAFLTKANARYHLICAEFDGRGNYQCMSASADSIYGPYGDRYLAVPHGGHNMLFRDKKGAWWSTFFGNDPRAPFRERPGILRIEFDRDGRIRPLIQ